MFLRISIGDEGSCLEEYKWFKASFAREALTGPEAISCSENESIKDCRYRSARRLDALLDHILLSGLLGNHLF